MRVAIVQDELIRRGGAEQVVLSMLKAFPNADLYTLCYNPKNTFPEYQNYKVNTSIFQKISTNPRIMQLLFIPFGIISMMLIKLKNYDVVILSNTHCSKYVSINTNAKVFIYTYTPFRLAWNPESYTEFTNRRGLLKYILSGILFLMRKFDKMQAQKGDFFLGMTEETAQRIKDAYLPKEVKIIPPPVKVENFYISGEVKEYYLVVSRLEFYKKVDLVINAFNKLNLPLIIVGKGSKENELKKIAKDNIQFLSGLSKQELANLYSGCQAFIFPQHEDYGITPLETNASGRPVIAYKAGGVLETMIPFDQQKDGDDFTCIFFNEQSEESLIDAVIQFQKLRHRINSNFIRQNAEKFSEDNFVKKFKNFILSKMSIY